MGAKTFTSCCSQLLKLQGINLYWLHKYLKIKGDTQEERGVRKILLDQMLLNVKDFLGCLHFLSFKTSFIFSNLTH